MKDRHKRVPDAKPAMPKRPNEVLGQLREQRIPKRRALARAARAGRRHVSPKGNGR